MTRKTAVLSATSLVILVLVLATLLTHPGDEKVVDDERASGAGLSATSGPIDGEAAEDDEAFAEEQREFYEKLRARTEAADRAPLPEPEAIVRRAAESVPETRQPLSYINNKVWEGEALFGRAVDWEPEIAADPGAPYVYWATTRYGKKYQLCRDCPSPLIVYRVSSDNGDTWGPVLPLCKCKGYRWQADPQIEVASDGTVYALILQGWRTVLIKSMDHGVTWSKPKDVARSMDWTDHGFLTISDDGQDVYVAFNHGESWVAASHDGGATFAKPVKTSPLKDENRRYYYHYKGAVLSNGVVAIAATSLSARPYARHNVRYYILRSANGGTSWRQIPIGTYKRQPECPRSRCRGDHLGGMTNVAKDDNDNLVATVAGATRRANGQVVYVLTSTDDGLTWSAPVRISPIRHGDRRVIASFPTIEGTGDGDFRLWWQDNYNGLNGWNTWYRQSSDTGATWSEKVRISDAINGAFYKSRMGYLADYGDYGGIAIMSDGRTIATWGEGKSYWGAGGSWVNRPLGSG